MDKNFIPLAVLAFAVVFGVIGFVVRDAGKEMTFELEAFTADLTKLQDTEIGDFCENNKRIKKRLAIYRCKVSDVVVNGTVEVIVTQLVMGHPVRERRFDAGLGALLR